MVVAPPGQHKTTGIVIPAILEHPGPALVVSTKPDVLTATYAARAARGEIFVYDPFGERSCAWNPVDGCAGLGGRDAARRGAHDRWQARSDNRGRRVVGQRRRRPPRTTPARSRARRKADAHVVLMGRAGRRRDAAAHSRYPADGGGGRALAARKRDRRARRPTRPRRPHARVDLAQRRPAAQGLPPSRRRTRITNRLPPEHAARHARDALHHRQRRAPAAPAPDHRRAHRSHLPSRHRARQPRTARPAAAHGARRDGEYRSAAPAARSTSRRAARRGSR